MQKGGKYMKTIIVYYSLGGFTKKIAQKLASKTGADLLRLTPVRDYPDTGAKKFLIGGRAAMAGAKPKLQPYNFDAKKYDRVVIGTPVWASSPAPPIRTFIDENREALEGRQFAAFFTQLGNGADKANKKLAKCLGLERIEPETVFFEPNKKDPHKENEAKLGDFAAVLRR